MRIDIVLDPSKNFEPATDEEIKVFYNPVDDYISRYTTAQKAYAGSGLEKIAQIMVRFANLKKSGKATKDNFDDAINFIGKFTSTGFNTADCFVGLAVNDLYKIMEGK